MANLEMNFECLKVFFWQRFQEGQLAIQPLGYQVLKEILHLRVASPSSCFAIPSLELGFCPQVLRSLAVAEMVRFGAHAKRRFVWLSFLRITGATEVVGKDMSPTELQPK